MAGYKWTPLTFDGTSINDASYTSRFEREDDPLRLSSHEPVEVAVGGEYSTPVLARQQPQSVILPLEVQILATTQVALDNFRKLFDADKGDVLLRVTDGAGSPNTWRLTVRVIDVLQEPQADNYFTVRLYVARPIWEADSLTTDVQTASASPKTFTITPGGTKRIYPVIELKPAAAKANTVDWLNRWRVIVASRTENAMFDSHGRDYPIDIADNSLDTAAEFAAVPSRLQTDLDDLRVWRDWEEVDRYPDPATSDATTKLWTGVTYRPMRKLTVKTAMTAGSPANGGEIEVSNSWELSPWDNSGFFVIGTELLWYGERTATKVKDIRRGVWGTTAASHAAAAIGYWVEHDLQILSNYTVAASPPASSDRQPVLDMANSLNTSWKYVSPFWVQGHNVRPGQWLPYFANIDANPRAEVVSGRDTGALWEFADLAPAAQRPMFNQLELYVPCGLDVNPAVLTHTLVVQDVLNLEAYVRDLEGYETLLKRYASNSDGAAVTVLLPSRVCTRLRYHAGFTMITGSDSTDSDISELAGAWTSQQFTLDEDSALWGWMVRLQKIDSPDGNVEIYIATDATDVPDKEASPIYALAASGLGTSMTDVMVRAEDTGVGIGYLVAKAGKYWLRLRRSVTTGGSVYAALAPQPNYLKGIFEEAFGAGATGPRYPTGAGDVTDDASVGTLAWTSPGNAAADDGVYATAVTASSRIVTHYLKALNFGFAIDASETIAGVMFEIECKTSVADKVGYRQARLVKGGTISGAPRYKKTLKPGTGDSIMTLGAPNDKWGLTLTPADINAATFGLALSLVISNATASVDYIRCTVYSPQYTIIGQATLDFAILGTPQSNIQDEAPTASGHVARIDDVILPLDSTTPRTPLIVRSPQQTIYVLRGVYQFDDTGQTITVDGVPMELNDILQIDCFNKTVKLIPTRASDPTIDMVGKVTFSDPVQWGYLNPGVANNLRYTEAPIGTVEVTTKYRSQWG